MAKNFTKNPTELYLTGSEPVKETPVIEGFVVPEGYKLVKESKTQRMQLLVTPTLYGKLKAAAKESGETINGFCNRIFEEYLKKD